MTTSSIPASLTSGQLWLGVASYLSLFCFVALLVRPDDPFVRFHVRQGSVLVMLELLAMSCFLQPLLFWPGLILAVITAFYSLVGMVIVLQHKTTPLPVVGRIVQVLNV